MASRAFTAKSRTVVSRNEFGLFAARCNEATKDAVKDIVNDGAKMSRSLAPVGRKRDSRPGHTPLKKSIRSSVSGYTGYWYSTSKHAMPIEMGAAPHIIEGKVSFYWLNSGRWFVWNDPSYGNWDPQRGVRINHPGNAAQPFLEPAFDKVARHGGTMRRVKASYRRHGLI